MQTLAAATNEVIERIAVVPVNAKSGLPYRGANALALQVATREKGFGSPVWASYQQWAALGARVRKGEKGSPVVYYRPALNEADPTGPAPCLPRTFYAFNAEQVDNAPAGILG